MRQTGHWEGDKPLSPEGFEELPTGSINSLDVEQARKEVEPFVKNPEKHALWSREFFLDVVSRIRIV